MKKSIIAILSALTLFIGFECTDVMVGHVTNGKLDGHVDWSSHELYEPFTYISYNGVNCYKGDKILTVEIYIPTNLEDGIVYRKDVVLK